MGPKIVLLADSHDDSRVVYSTILQYGGFVVLEARNGAEALELIPEQMPHLVVTELRLPVINGGEVLQRLKQHPLTAGIPILVVTADARPAARRQAEEAGCDAFVAKPCSPLDLLQRVCDIMDRLTLPPVLVQEMQAAR